MIGRERKGREEGVEPDGGTCVNDQILYMYMQRKARQGKA